MHLILIGAPGSGKGTQAEKLINEHGYLHISTGDLLRQEVAKASELGLKIKGLIDSGQLVDDLTVLELFKNNLNLNSSRYILDGFPRTLNQCKLLDEQVLTGQLYKVIYFKVNESQIVDRIINRRIAPKSGKIYNLLTNPPVVDGVCDISGEPLIHRDDDKEAVIKKRLQVFAESIKAILSYYSDSGRLYTLDATMSPELVYKEITKNID